MGLGENYTGREIALAIEARSRDMRQNCES